MNFPVINLYKWGAIAIALVATHAAIAWWAWDTRGDIAREAQLKAEAEAASEARDDERQLHAESIETERQHVLRMRQYLDSIAPGIEEAKLALARIPACPVSVRIVERLQPYDPRSTGVTGTTPRIDGATTATPPIPGNDRGAAAVVPALESIPAAVLVGVAKTNYDEVCTPNAIQVEDLQKYVRRLREVYESLRD